MGGRARSDYPRGALIRLGIAAGLPENRRASFKFKLRCWFGGIQRGCERLFAELFTSRGRHHRHMQVRDPLGSIVNHHCKVDKQNGHPKRNATKSPASRAGMPTNGIIHADAPDLGA